MKILVTGASGLLGANLLYALPKSWDVLAVTQGTYLSGVSTIQMDLTHDNIGPVVKEYQPDVIVSAAGITNVDACEGLLKEKAHQLHVAATDSIARAAAEVRAHLIHISTDHIFDGTHGGWRVEDEAHPQNEYARTKCKGEEAVRASGADAAIIRTNFFGFNLQEKDDFAGWIVGALRRGEQLKMFTDAVFSPILVNTLVANIIHVIEKRLTGTMHIAARNACSKYDFAVALARACGFSTDAIAKTTLDETTLAAKRPKDMSLDVSATEAMLGVQLPTVQESITVYTVLSDNGFQQELRQALCTS